MGKPPEHCNPLTIGKVIAVPQPCVMPQGGLNCAHLPVSNHFDLHAAWHRGEGTITGDQRGAQ